MLFSKEFRQMSDRYRLRCDLGLFCWSGNCRWFFGQMDGTLILSLGVWSLTTVRCALEFAGRHFPVA